MTFTKYIVATIILSIFPNIVFADFYKCTVNGKTVYADQPCGNEQSIVNVSPKSTSQTYKNNVDRHLHNKASSSPGSEMTKAKSNNDYYSVENQLKRIEQENEKLRSKREQKYHKDEQLRLQEKQVDGLNKPKVDHAKCKYYHSRVREQDYKMRKGYKSVQHKLSEERYLNHLRILEAEHCG